MGLNLGGIENPLFKDSKDKDLGIDGKGEIGIAETFIADKGKAVTTATTLTTIGTIVIPDLTHEDIIEIELHAQNTGAASETTSQVKLIYSGFLVHAGQTITFSNYRSLTIRGRLFKGINNASQDVTLLNLIAEDYAAGADTETNKSTSGSSATYEGQVLTITIQGKIAADATNMAVSWYAKVYKKI